MPAERYRSCSRSPVRSIVAPLGERLDCARLGRAGSRALSEQSPTDTGCDTRWLFGVLFRFGRAEGPGLEFVFRLNGTRSWWLTLDLLDWPQHLEPSVSCGDNFVRVGSLDKWFGVVDVVLCDEVVNSGLQIDQAPEDPTLEPSSG